MGAQTTAAKGAGGIDNPCAGLLAALLLPTSLLLVLLAIYANTAELPTAPSFLVGFVTGLLTVAAGALLYLAGREIAMPRR